jgi:hypothetical protein
MLEMTMGSLNTVPFRMLRMVPLGDFHICGPGGAGVQGCSWRSAGAQGGHATPSCMGSMVRCGISKLLCG